MIFSEIFDLFQLFFVIQDATQILDLLVSLDLYFEHGRWSLSLLYYILRYIQVDTLEQTHFEKGLFYSLEETVT